MEKNIVVIEPQSGWRFLNLKELREYRDLFYFLVWKNIKVRYAQSVLGVGWAIIQPVFSMIVFTIVFGNLAQVGSDGAPYALFSFVALVPWTYFSNSLSDTTGSLITNRNMLTKIYFPRLIFPMTSILSKLVDFSISMCVLFILMIWFSASPTIGVVVIPYLIILMMLTAVGLGMWLSALAVQFRDIKYSMHFGVQLLMYLAPVVYPASLIPAEYRLLYGINPMVGVIEGFRSALIGTNPMPWDFIIVGTIAAILIFLSGAMYFKRMERIFADVA